MTSNKDISLTCCNGTHDQLPPYSEKYLGTVLFHFLNVTSVGCETASTATDSTSKQEAQQAGCTSYNKQIFSLMKCANANTVNIIAIIYILKLAKQS